ncbi:hypothetical protein OF83DRAFT_246913 [Amylostereum chailletii]|nr:hypothetical protein OF83DRAFT_246913 [Amylostereum chailletii]
MRVSRAFHRNTSRGDCVTAIFVLAACITSVILTVSLFVVIAGGHGRRYTSTPLITNTQRSSYLPSFDGTDLPIFVPLSDLPTRPETLPLIQTSFEESVHFSIDDPNAPQEWLQMSPLGSGGVVLGPNSRVFVVTAFHEAHCVRIFYDAYVKPNPNWAHLQHCVNYLRQLSLCRADQTVERGDFTRRNFTEERRAMETRVCRDWDAIYDNAEHNWVRWVKSDVHSRVSVTA